MCKKRGLGLGAFCGSKDSNLIIGRLSPPTQLLLLGQTSLTIRNMATCLAMWHSVHLMQIQSGEKGLQDNICDVHLNEH